MQCSRSIQNRAFVADRRNSAAMGGRQLSTVIFLGAAAVLVSLPGCSSTPNWQALTTTQIQNAIAERIRGAALLRVQEKDRPRNEFRITEPRQLRAIAASFKIVSEKLTNAYDPIGPSFLLEFSGEQFVMTSDGVLLFNGPTGDFAFHIEFADEFWVALTAAAGADSFFKDRDCQDRRPTSLNSAFLRHTWVAEKAVRLAIASAAEVVIEWEFGRNDKGKTVLSDRGAKEALAAALEFDSPVYQSRSTVGLRGINVRFGDTVLQVKRNGEGWFLDQRAYADPSSVYGTLRPKIFLTRRFYDAVWQAAKLQGDPPTFLAPLPALSPWTNFTGRQIEQQVRERLQGVQRLDLTFQRRSHDFRAAFDRAARRHLTIDRRDQIQRLAASFRVLEEPPRRGKLLDDLVILRVGDLPLIAAAFGGCGWLENDPNAASWEREQVFVPVDPAFWAELRALMQLPTYKF